MTYCSVFSMFWLIPFRLKIRTTGTIKYSPSSSRTMPLLPIRKPPEFQALGYQPFIWVCFPTHISLVSTAGLNQLSTVLETSSLVFKVILHHKEKSHTRDLGFWMCNVLMSFLFCPKSVVKQLTESCGSVRTPDCMYQVKTT